MGLAQKVKDFMGYPGEEYYSDEEYESGAYAPENGRFEAVLVKPERFEEASGIVDHLLENRIVVINLEKVERNISRRLIDFVSGATYARNGQIRHVAQHTYVITPAYAEFISDQLDSNCIYL